MLHDLQKRNHIALFTLIDRNADGVLTWEDHELIIDRFAAVTGSPKGSAVVEALRGAIRSNWEELLKRADANGDGKVSLDEWLDHHDRMLSTEEGYRLAVAAICDALFALADDDRDGKLTLANYTMLLDVYGADGVRAKDAFAHIDVDRDGIVDHRGAPGGGRAIRAIVEPARRGTLAARAARLKPWSRRLARRSPLRKDVCLEQGRPVHVFRHARRPGVAHGAHARRRAARQLRALHARGTATGGASVPDKTVVTVNDTAIDFSVVIGAKTWVPRGGGLVEI